MKKKHILYIIGLLMMIGVGYAYYRLNSVSNSGQVIIGDAVFTVQIADSDYERAQGLSGVPSLRDNQGMLFLFDAPGNYLFWMKDMLIPIDIVWIDSNWQIVHIEHAVTPDSYPKTFGTEIPSLYVLEVAAGTAERLNIRVGNTIQFVW